MKHVLFVMFGLLFALAGVLIQRHNLITVPAYWAFYGGAFGLIGSWILDRRWGEKKEQYAARESALDILQKHGLRAHYYLPGIGLEDRELANACHRMAAAGHIITDSTGALVGKVATARLTPEELAQERRASFRLVKTEK